MNQDNGPIQGSRKATRQGDGRLSVTLLGLFGLLAAFAAFGLTARFITPQDTLYGRLPADGVAVYIHMNAARAAPLLLPENVRADEIARFALAADGQDLVWGTLFAWHEWHRPDDDEMMFLAGANARRLDDRTYFLGDQRLADYFAAADERIARLDADIAAVRALATVRGLAPVQGYLDPALLVRNGRAGTKELLSGADRQVFALDPNGPMAFNAVALPVLTAASYPAWLGFAPDPAAGDRSTGAAPASALLTLSGDRSMFDPLAVIFQRVEMARRASALDRTSQLEAAENDLRRLLDSPSVLSLFEGNDGSGPDFAASYPGLAPENLARALTTYMSAALPAKTTLVLPDEDNAVELRFDPVKFVMSDKSGIKSLISEDLKIRLYLAPSAAGGAVLASTTELLNPDSQEKYTNKQNGRCSSISGSKLIIDGPILAVLGQLLDENVAHSPLSLSTLKSALFVDNGNGVIVGCGYK